MAQTPIDRRAVPAGARFSIAPAGDGWALRRFDWLQPEGAAVRGQLFFTGGRGDFAEKYIEAYWHWHGRGWNVTSLDWRGQGGSRGDIVGGHLDSFDPLVEDCATFLAAWARERPGPHVAIGHSMGGHLLLRALAEHELGIDAAVLVAPMLGINSRPVSPRLAPLVARVMSVFRGRTPAWKIDKEGPTARIRQVNLTSCEERFGDEQWWKEQQQGFELGPPSWGWLNAAFHSMRRPPAEALRGLDLPILLLGTDRDRLVIPAAIRRAAALLPRGELHMFDKAAHELLRESDPVRSEALARIDAFLDAEA